MTAALTPSLFDAVLAVNVVHRLPLARILPRLASLVATGGRLIIQDVVARDALRYLGVNVAAALWTRLRHVGRVDRAGRDVKRLYDRHGAGEEYLRPDNVRQALTPFLPGVAVTHHLEWRYTAIWNRPPAA
jgi:hypothetical protein